MSIPEQDARVLEFIVDRLVHVYDENPNVDYILAARKAIARAQQPSDVEQDVSRIKGMLDAQGSRLARIERLLARDVG